jgi:hypothetical protein
LLLLCCLGPLGLWVGPWVSPPLGLHQAPLLLLLAMHQALLVPLVLLLRCRSALMLPREVE